MTSPNLSPVDLFLQAGPIVKGVIVLLALSSVWCWAIILRCAIGLGGLRRAASRLELDKANAINERIATEGRTEAAITYPAETVTEYRQRVLGAMRRAAQAHIEHAQKGLANLAVISSVAPFVGLFGTVWGIMTSFIGIAAAKETTLAVVAPGIAEALFATAVGLAAAIPAAFAYNRYVAAFNGLGRRYGRLLEARLNSVIGSTTSTQG